MNRTSVLGVGISAVNLETAAKEVARWIATREKHYVAVTNVHAVIEAQDDPDFKTILNHSGLTVPDGMPLVWLLRRAGRSDVGRVTGFDLVHAVSRDLAANGGSAFYYGGTPGIAEKLAATLASKYPGLRTAGTWCPPFRALTSAEEEEIVAVINASGADVVWVGLSTPKQERWMARFRPRLNVPVFFGVGAAFDYLTGGIKRAPDAIGNLGLEWAYRLWQEPRRLWRRYATTNPRFLYLIARDKLGV